MARKRHSDEDILKLLREIELKLTAGDDVASVCRSVGISDATYYNWRKRFGGMARSQLSEMKSLEKENARLKKIVAELELDKLILNGHDTTTANADGTQTEASLSILLNPDRPWRALIEEIIPSRYTHEIDLLFNFSGGPSIRNQFAHGKVPANEFWSQDFVYAAWLIIHLAVLSIARRWGNLEEVFARVTGLRRAKIPVEGE